jgi:hypothetical protein
MKSSTAAAGHPITILDIDVDEMGAHGHLLDEIFRTERSGAVIRRAFSEDMVRGAVTQLTSTQLADEWASPNRGMPGGEIRTIGDAATPTFTSLGGPTAARYAASTAQHEGWTQAIFGDAHPTPCLQHIFSTLFGGRPAAAPTFAPDSDWAPFNYRALDPGVQIYSHHDNHYGLQIYQNMASALDRSTILSWFVTLQPAEQNGNLILYGLWGSDPNPPMLPTRFLDTEALERDFQREVLDLRAGDLVIFDSGRHVHRVSPVEGALPRLTVGGFLTADVERTRLAFWS